MPQLTIGTTPVQLIKPNKKRTAWEIQFVPSSIIATNTGLVFVQVGDPPGNATESNQYDEVLNAGASVKRSLRDGDSAYLVQSAVWLRSDTANQIVIIKEVIDEKIEG